MRITIESTNSEPQFSNKVSIETPIDGYTIDEFRDELLMPALIAYGWHETTVNELFFDTSSYEEAGEDAIEVEVEDEDQ